MAEEQQNTISAVLFDLDGVLIDAKEWHYEALNKALSLFGMEISRYEHLVTYDGLPTKRKLEMLSRERGLPEALHEFIAQMKQQYTLEMIYAQCKPKFNHEYALSRLKAEGYDVAVCSNAVRESVELMLDRANLSRYVDFVLSNEDVSRPKPAPDIYLKAFDILKKAPEECLIVEDNEHGIKAAVASGGHLLRVILPEDVTYQNISRRIHEVSCGPGDSLSKQIKTQTVLANSKNKIPQAETKADDSLAISLSIKE